MTRLLVAFALLAALHLTRRRVIRTGNGTEADDPVCPPVDCYLLGLGR